MRNAHIAIVFAVYALDTETLKLDEDAWRLLLTYRRCFVLGRPAEVLTDVSLGNYYLLLYLGASIGASEYALIYTGRYGGLRMVSAAA